MPRRPGRPPLDALDPSVKVCICVPGRVYGELCTEALRHNVSLGAVIRRRLRLVERERRAAGDE